MGLLYGYDKQNEMFEFVIGLPNLPFDLAENINDFPNSMKCVVDNNIANAYLPNTLVKESESGIYFVVKSDMCEFLSYDSDGTTPVYRHTIDFGDAMEYLSSVRVPPCVFPQNKYTIAEFFTRLFHIAKINITIEWSNYPFIASTARTKFFSFDKNHQLSTAVKDICKSFNVVPFLWYDDVLMMGFKPKYAYTTPIGEIDTIFPNKQRKSISSAENYLTRVYSNLQNVLNVEYVMYPNTFGVHSIDNTSLAFDGDKAIIPLPSKIDMVSYIQVLRQCRIVRAKKSSAGVLSEETLSGTTKYPNLTNDEWIEFGKTVAFTYITNSDIEAASFGDEYTIGRIDRNNDWEKGFNLLAPKDFETTLPTDASLEDQRYSFTWEHKGNHIKVPTGFTYPSIVTTLFDYEIISKPIPSSTDSEVLIVRMYNDLHYKTFFRVYYRPIGDVVLSYDNIDNAQDERPNNQVGTLLDGYSTSKLISSYAQESMGETLIRYKEFDAFSSIYACGQSVLVSNEPYIITQRSIDFYKDKFLVLFNLSRAKVARDENIEANTDIATYALPDDNLVKRTQIYKDYLEIEVGHITTYPKYHETAYYESLGHKVLSLGTPIDNYMFVGANVNLDFIATTYDSSDNVIDRFYVPATKQVFVRSHIYRADFDDNFIIGIKQSSTNTQTPIRYADASGDVEHIECYFISSDVFKENMTESDYFDLPQISDAVFATLTDTSDEYAIKIEDEIYKKTSYEIPVFQYHIEINDVTNTLGQVVVADNILYEYGYLQEAPFYDVPKFYYMISNTPITQENAQSLWTTIMIGGGKTYTDNVAYINEPEANVDYLLTLIETLPNTYNAISLTNKCIGFFASGSATFSTPKFMFAINFYKGTSDYLIPININNWKI
jgi:hypothetical protein